MNQKIPAYIANFGHEKQFLHPYSILGFKLNIYMVKYFYMAGLPRPDQLPSTQNERIVRRIYIIYAEHDYSLTSSCPLNGNKTVNVGSYAGKNADDALENAVARLGNSVSCKTCVANMWLSSAAIKG